MTVKIYLSGHISREGDKFPDWREELISLVDDNLLKLEHAGDKVSFHNIEWLIPKSYANKTLTAAKDIVYINSCDLAVVNLDLNIGKCLGSMWEYGYLCKMQKPVLLINHHSGLNRTDFLEYNADIVAQSMREAADIISSLASP